MIRTHVSLNVTDLEQSVAFYAKLLGSQPAKQRHDWAKFETLAPALNLTLNAQAAGAKATAEDGVRAERLSHLGIEVDDPLTFARERERITGLGLDTLDEPAVVCCYAEQSKLWITDPDGNSWELFIVHGDVDTPSRDGRSAADACCAVDCCVEGTP